MKSSHVQALAASALALAAASAQGAMLENGNNILTIEGTSDAYGAFVSGSYFGMDTNGNSKIAATEKISLKSGTEGIIVGVASAPGASHGGGITAGDTNEVTSPWEFFSNTGSDFFLTPMTAISETKLDFSGWRVTWNGIPVINMGSGSWETCLAGNPCTSFTDSFEDGVANFTWDGVLGSTYTITYHATVPEGDPSGFGGVQYELFLTGKVLPIPEAETWAMMLAGLGLVGGLVARRRKTLA